MPKWPINGSLGLIDAKSSKSYFHSRFLCRNWTQVLSAFFNHCRTGPAAAMAISDAWRSWTTSQRKIMTWHSLCNLPRHWRFWPTKYVWIQSFPWWKFCLIKAIWHKFVFNQCLAPVQCIGHQPNWTYTTIKKPDRGNQIGLDQKHGRLLIVCLTGMENYHRLKRAAQMPLSWKMRSRIALWTQLNTMPEKLCCKAHQWALRLGQM